MDLNYICDQISTTKQITITEIATDYYTHVMYLLVKFATIRLKIDHVAVCQEMLLSWTLAKQNNKG